MSSILDAAREAFEAGDARAAVRLTRTHLRRNVNDGRGWEVLGLVHFARGRFRVAVSSLERASLLIPLAPCARICLAHGYAHLGRLELSVDLLIELVKDESLTLPLLLKVANCFDAIDQPRLAMQACRVACRRDPDFAQAYYDLGYYSARCGHRPRIAETLARKAISLEPQSVCFRVGLASMLSRQGRDQEAVDLIGGFSNEQIAGISCRKCLGRIAGLFRDAGDFRRSILCHQRLLILAQDEPTPVDDQDALGESEVKG